MPQQMPRCFILHEIALPADFKALLSTLLEKAARNGQNALGAAVGVSAHRACQRECEDRTKRVHETCEAGVAYSIRRQAHAACGRAHGTCMRGIACVFVSSSEVVRRRPSTKEPRVDSGVPR